MTTISNDTEDSFIVEDHYSTVSTGISSGRGSVQTEVYSDSDITLPPLSLTQSERQERIREIIDEHVYSVHDEDEDADDEMEDEISNSLSSTRSLAPSPPIPIIFGTGRPSPLSRYTGQVSRGRIRRMSRGSHRNIRGPGISSSYSLDLAPLRAHIRPLFGSSSSEDISFNRMDYGMMLELPEVNMPRISEATEDLEYDTETTEEL